MECWKVCVTVVGSWMKHAGNVHVTADAVPSVVRTAGVYLPSVMLSCVDGFYVS